MLGRMARPRFFVLLARGPGCFVQKGAPRLLALGLLASVACDGTPAASSKPPPLPPFPGLSAKPKAVAEPSADALPEKEGAHARSASDDARHPAANRAAKHASSAAPQAKPVPAAKPATAPKPATAAAPSPKPATAPTPTAPLVATTPKPALVSKVSVPKTVHVQIDVPAGLQADLDHDPRMQPWVNQVVATIDRCYGSESKSNTKLSGTIEVLVTMHENERPDADIKQLPPALSPIVACATGGLMRTKMPLFTGKENSRYSVRLRFAP
jgi:hypothetical protein